VRNWFFDSIKVGKNSRQKNRPITFL